jgi:polyhydroxyalkanoate synthesis repressor PhaR
MPRLIKRYANRRLYDVQKKKTITLIDLAEIIKAGEDVQVVDNKTKEDITLPTLFQILTQEAREWKDTMPSPKVVRELILKGGGTMADAIKKAMVAGMGALNVTKEKVEELVDDLIKKGHLDKKDRAQVVHELVNKAEARSTEAKKWIEESVRAALTRVKPAKEEEVDALKKQVDDLGKTIARLEKKLEVRGKKNKK